MTYQLPLVLEIDDLDARDTRSEHDHAESDHEWVDDLDQRYPPI